MPDVSVDHWGPSSWSRLGGKEKKEEKRMRAEGRGWRVEGGRAEDIDGILV